MAHRKRSTRMNLFSRILSSRKPRQLDDPVFGSLEFDRGLWARIPKETKGFILVLIAPESGPVEEQREFFRTLSRSLEATVESARRFIQKSAGDIDACNLALYAVDIGSPEEIAQGIFVIEFLDADQNQIHRAEFVGGTPRFMAKTTELRAEQSLQPTALLGDGGSETLARNMKSLVALLIWSATLCRAAEVAPQDIHPKVFQMVDCWLSDNSAPVTTEINLDAVRAEPKPV